MNVALGAFLAFSAAFVWALTSVVSKVIMRLISPLSLNVIRLIISAALYLVIIAFTGFPSLNHQEWFILFISGVIGFTVGDWVFLEGIHRLGVSKSAILVTLHPILTMFLAHYLLNRTLNVFIILGALSIVSAVLIVASESDGKKTDWKGIGFVLAADTCWTAAVLMMDWLMSSGSAFSIIGLRIGFGALASVVFMRTVLEDVKSLDARGWGLVFSITFLGTVLGQYFFALAVKVAGSSVATPVTESSPIMASLMAVAFLKEPFTKRLLYALALTSAGIILIAAG
ncbi:MAG: drug/metabolite transporter, family [Thermococcaceae archaeon]|nr:drug/metabolite transporter, family [Thermococcaceae archaeon]